MAMRQRQYRSVGSDGIQRVLKQWAVPVGIAPSGSIGDNGALTLGTALPSSHAGGTGEWLYFPAGAVFAGSAAGLYWCRMDTTTAGTVYNTVLSGGSEIPYTPTIDVPFATTGPGAYTGFLSPVTVCTMTVPGGSMGKNGALRIEAMFTLSATAGNKVFDFLLGGSSLGDRQNLSSNAVSRVIRQVQNRNSETRQISDRANTVGGAYDAGPAFLSRTVDTTLDQPLSITLDLATATDFCILEAASVVLLPG